MIKIDYDVENYSIIAYRYDENIICIHLFSFMELHRFV